MKCTKCGTEFSEGIFCPECGTKCVADEAPDEVVQETKKMERAEETPQKVEEVQKAEPQKTEPVIAEAEDKIKNQKQPMQTSNVDSKQSLEKTEKEPWYLSWGFIAVLLILSLFIGIFWIPFIVLLVMRLIKKKKK